LCRRLLRHYYNEIRLRPPLYEPWDEAVERHFQPG